jgi:hypothetical protein
MTTPGLITNTHLRSAPAIAYSAALKSRASRRIDAIGREEDFNLLRGRCLRSQGQREYDTRQCKQQEELFHLIPLLVAPLGCALPRLIHSNMSELCSDITILF